MSCVRCAEDRVISISGKCDDRFSARYKGQSYQGYSLRGIGIGGGDYINIEYCLNCGQMQGEFPTNDPDFFDENKQVKE
jgi:hypothetical protein